EIDIKADLSEFDNEDHYMSIKTQKLLDFGVKQVIWILTEKRAILVAEANAEWLRKSWNEEIDVLGCMVNLEKILAEDENNW
ncbi:MAG: Uma2 family endonuclease, partial [Bacteroidetes bacterium]